LGLERENALMGLTGFMRQYGETEALRIESNIKIVFNIYIKKDNFGIMIKFVLNLGVTRNFWGVSSKNLIIKKRKKGDIQRYGLGIQVLLRSNFNKK
jgi:hypothetical protein